MTKTNRTAADASITASVTEIATLIVGSIGLENALMGAPCYAAMEPHRLAVRAAMVAGGYDPRGTGARTVGVKAQLAQALSKQVADTLWSMR